MYLEATKKLTWLLRRRSRRTCVLRLHWVGDVDGLRDEARLELAKKPKSCADGATRKVSSLVNGCPVGDERVRSQGVSKTRAVDTLRVVEPELNIRAQHGQTDALMKHAKRTTLGKLMEILLNSSMNASKAGSSE